jgi:ABC-type dipeptide/oligopeptide/nickel transport system permease component
MTDTNVISKLHLASAPQSLKTALVIAVLPLVAGPCIMLFAVVNHNPDLDIFAGVAGLGVLMASVPMNLLALLMVCVFWVKRMRHRPYYDQWMRLSEVTAVLLLACYPAAALCLRVGMAAISESLD